MSLEIFDYISIWLFAVTVAFWVTFSCCLIIRRRKQGQVSAAGSMPKSTKELDPTRLEVSGAYVDLDASTRSTGSQYVDLKELENAGQDVLCETYDGSRMPTYPAPPPPRPAPSPVKWPWQQLGNWLMGGLKNGPQKANDTEEEAHEYVDLDDTPEDTDNATAKDTDATTSDNVKGVRVSTSGAPRQDGGSSEKAKGVTLPIFKRAAESPNKTEKENDMTETYSGTSSESDDVTEDGYDITEVGSNKSRASGGFEPGAERSMWTGSDVAGGQNAVGRNASSDLGHDQRGLGDTYEEITAPAAPPRIKRT